MRVDLLYQWEKVQESTLKSAYESEDLLRKNNLDAKLIDQKTGEIPFEGSENIIEVHVRKIHGDAAKDLLSGEITHVITKPIKKTYFSSPRRLYPAQPVKKRYGGVGRYIFPLMILVAIMSLLRMLYEFAFL